MIMNKCKTIEAAAHVVNMYDQSMTGKRPTESREILLDEAIEELRKLLGSRVILPAKGYAMRSSAVRGYTWQVAQRNQ